MYVLFNPKNDTDKALRKINVIYFIINGGGERDFLQRKNWCGFHRVEVNLLRIWQFFS